MQPASLSTGNRRQPIGAMNSKIDLLMRPTKRDAKGEFLPPDVFAANLWARIQFMASKYQKEPQQQLTESTHKIILRWLPGVTSAMTVRNDSQIFNIEAVIDPDDKQTELWLYCYLRNDGATGVQA